MSPSRDGLLFIIIIIIVTMHLISVQSRHRSLEKATMLAEYLELLRYM